MSRQQFTSKNNINSVLTIQKSGLTSSFDPEVVFTGVGTKRVSWRLFNGTQTTQIAGNNITYTGFTTDSNIRTIEMRGNSFNSINRFNLENDNIYGNIDLSKLNNWTNNGFGIFLNSNLQLTGVTNPKTTLNINNYQISNCGLTGNIDMTPLSGQILSFLISNNLNLTGITHNTSLKITTQYNANNCNLTGNLNLPFTGLGGVFWVQENPNLTGITHAPSSNNFSFYWAYGCNLKGNLDLTSLSGLGGSFFCSGNLLLTGITNPASSQNFTFYNLSNCNLKGNLDLTPLSGFGGQFDVRSNTGLTSITHTTSTNDITKYLANNCNLTGTIDLTKLTKLGSSSSGTGAFIYFYNNTNLTNILFPTITQYFKNDSNFLGSRAFSLYNCNLDYVDFTKLSGATLVSGTTQGPAGIDIQNNLMSSSDVNHILVDFSGNATYNPTGWSNVNLNISGTNGAPNSSSGGYDGIAARNFLTGSPYNWTITHS